MAYHNFLLYHFNFICPMKLDREIIMYGSRHFFRKLYNTNRHSLDLSIGPQQNACHRDIGQRLLYYT